ncbi:MAG TPA: hypothetical protein PLV45_17775 [bacterium]|nr:hypothetical protein [bacterium]
MFLEKRPTCVTVIGWVWIVLGGLMVLSGAMAMVIAITVLSTAGNESELSPIFHAAPYLCVVQIVAAVLGLVSGIHFLRLKAWSRSVLEALTWLVLIYVIGFMGYIVYDIAFTGSASNLIIIDEIIALTMGIMITAVYTVPLAIMLWYLRGPKVCNAMKTGD